MIENNRIANFLYRKWQKPEPQLNWLHRPRLMMKLDAFLEQSDCLHIIAPGGSGKSVMLAQWAAQFQGELVWFTLDQSDNNPYRLIRNLSYALLSQFPDFDWLPPALEHLSYELDPYFFLEYLFLRLNEFNQSIIIVLDQIQETIYFKFSVNEVLLYILKNHSKKIKFVVSGRESSPHLHCYNIDRYILSEEMAMTHDEIDKLYHLYGIKLESSETQFLAHITAGQPIYLDWLAAQGINTKSKLPLSGRPDKINPFAQEYDRLNHTIQQSLVMLSTLRIFNQNLASQILGKDYFYAAWEVLQRQNWLNFVSRDSEHDWYEILPVIKNYLSASLYQQPQGNRNALFEKITCWYLKQDYFEEAAYYAVQSGNRKWNLKMLNAHALEMLINRSFDTLIHWADHFRDDELLDAPFALLALILLFADKQDIKQALHWHDILKRSEANDLFSEAGWVEQGVPFALLQELSLAAVERLQDLEAETYNASNKAYSLIQANTPLVLKGLISYYLVTSLMILDRYQEAFLYFDNSILLLQQCKFYDYVIKLYIYRGQYFAIMADFQTAEENYRTAFSVYNQYELKNNDNAQLLLNHLVLSAFIHYDLDEMRKWLAYSQLNSYNIQAQSSISVFFTPIRVLIGTGEFELAREMLNKWRASSYDFPLSAAYQPFYFYLQFLLHIRTGQANAVQAQISQLENRIKSHDNLIFSHEIKGLMHAYLFLKQISKAKSLLETFRLYLEKNAAPLYQYIFSCLQLCLFYAQANPGFKNKLHEVLLATQQLKTYGLLIEELVYYPDLISYILNEPEINSILDLKLKSYLSDLQPTDLKDAPKKITQRELQILNLLQQGYTNQQIAEMFCVTLNTIKMHNKNIFKKLNVKNRLQAVKIASQSGLISRSSEKKAES